MTAQHASAGPSSANMWLNCPASITKTRGMTRPSSTYAREGTAAHHIAQKIIEGDMFPPTHLTVEGEQFVIGRDMLLHLRPYVGAAMMLMNTADEFRLEQRVVVPSGGLVWGTADCFGWHDIISTLEVMDLKYGKGVPVAADSAQLKIYALGAMDHLGVEPDMVRLSIYQPRLDPKPDVHIMQGEELMEWHDDVMAPAVERILNMKEDESAGPWCRFCVRKNECSAFAGLKAGHAASIFDDGIDMPA